MDDYEAGPEGASRLLSSRLDVWFAGHFRTHDALLHRRLGALDH